MGVYERIEEKSKESGNAKSRDQKRTRQEVRKRRWGCH